MTVGQRIAAAAALALSGLAVAVVASAVLLSWPVAAVLWLGGIAALAAAGLAVPLRTGGLASRPDPARDAAEAASRLAAGAAPPAGGLNPLCHQMALLPRAPSGKVVVLIHGISSCPRAFVDFAPRLHARGHAVIAARLPCNGHADRATDALRHLTAEKLAAFGDRVADAAAGLGGEVVVCGISAGGTVAAWIGQNRADVARVVLVAPFLGLPGPGAAGNRLMMRAMLMLPEVSLWKDPRLRERFAGMPHAYKRQSSHGTAQVMRLGLATLDAARARRPAAAAAALVINDNDRAVDNALALRLAALWEGRGMPVARHRFARAHGLGHEIIDPMEPGADPDLTYPVLVRLIEGAGVGDDRDTA